MVAMSKTAHLSSANENLGLLKMRKWIIIITWMKQHVRSNTFKYIVKTVMLNDTHSKYSVTIPQQQRQ